MILRPFYLRWRPIDFRRRGNSLWNVALHLHLERVEVPVWSHRSFRLWSESIGKWRRHGHWRFWQLAHIGRDVVANGRVLT